VESDWRVACVRIPRFPIGAVWRNGREELVARSHRADEWGRQTTRHWDDELVALSDGGSTRGGGGPPARLRAVSRAAGRARVRAGMTVAESSAYCAGLDVRAWDERVIEEAVMMVTAELVAASPRVTPVVGSPGTWWVGASGFDPLAGERDPAQPLAGERDPAQPSAGERDLVRSLVRIAGAWHPDARVAVADSCVAARAATWGTEAVCIVPRGGCAAYLARAPLSLIPMDEELRSGLIALGFRRIGAFAALAASDVEHRWGDVGLTAWRLARGDDRRRPTLARPDVRRAVSADLPSPTTTAEPVLFLVRAALDRLATQLVADGRTAATIALTLTLDRPPLDDDTPSPRTITREGQLTRPTARAAPLFERCRALLDRFTLSAPILGITVAITETATAAIVEQGELLHAHWRDLAAVDAALDRLRAELGPTAVVRPVTRDHHRPDRAGAWVTDPPVPPPRPTRRSSATLVRNGASTRTGRTGARPLVPVSRLLESPEAIDVECDGDRPITIHWRARHLPIVHTLGPERLSGDWWDDEHCRDYWHCTTATAELLVFLDYTRGAQWYVHGWRD
jgi:protein ImuB